ncbi:hypothetical protein Ccrd_001271 [Cynara cardunculus var. scolymus]|uniref:ATP synthase subunit e, mitochondrial n=1 Tax=Cynara cardunculus var. scolymus TaxID=59895 RepID=A0A124SDE1_CYNCS|nr:hypothetical protein Ccrd_001271 [Cynara cardunculus var. scolymus]
MLLLLQTHNASAPNSRAYNQPLISSFTPLQPTNSIFSDQTILLRWRHRLALTPVARVSAFSAGLLYGSIKLKYLKAKVKSQRKAEAKAHH